MIKIDGDTVSLESEEHIILLGAKQGAVFESGTHKTHFISELRDQVTNHLLESNKNLIIVDQVSTAGDLRELTEDDCVILDEANLNVGILETFVERVRRSHAYLISVGRLMVRQLDCSVDAVYCINYDGEFKIEQVFEPCGVNPVKNDGVYCEDCGAVAGVYEECLNTSVVSVGGRFGFIRNVKGSAPFIIADKPKSGGKGGKSLRKLLDVGKIDYGVYARAEGEAGYCEGIYTVPLFLLNKFEFSKGGSVAQKGPERISIFS